MNPPPLARDLGRLPNLQFRSASVLVLLYALFAAALYVMVSYFALRPLGAAVFFAVAGGGQFILGPFLMDLSLRYLYRVRWVTPEELPAPLRASIETLCTRQGMRVPAVGIIDDGAPQALTYGHYPGNARLVLSRGTIELLSAEELEAVVAHELGHAAHWDMLIMTVALAVPLMFFFMYRGLERLARKAKKEKARSAYQTTAFFTLVVYHVTLRVSLWLSRLREYHADRFAAAATGNPSALARALIKIAYGLAARPERVGAGAASDEDDTVRYNPLAALSFFDRGAALNLVVGTQGAGASGGEIDIERLKDTMHWDLWNPWASFHEISSTHPLVAKRLLALSDHARALGQEPFVVFDRVRPESYWDEFLVDAVVVALPVLSALALLFYVELTGWASEKNPLLFAVPLIPLGVFGLLKTVCAHRGSLFPPRQVADLMSQVKVSPVRPITATLEGTIIGKGVPGLVYSEDFVMRDASGIMLLDYRQPFQFWSFYFGLLRAQAYQGRRVRVTGWFRRAPMPYLELSRLDLLAADGTVQLVRRCYAYHAKIIWNLVLALGGSAAVLYALGYIQAPPPPDPATMRAFEAAADDWWVAVARFLHPFGAGLSQLAANIGVPVTLVCIVAAVPLAALLFALGMAAGALWEFRLTLWRWLLR